MVELPVAVRDMLMDEPAVEEVEVEEQLSLLSNVLEVEVMLVLELLVEVLDVEMLLVFVDDVLVAAVEADEKGRSCSAHRVEVLAAQLAIPWTEAGVKN